MHGARAAALAVTIVISMAGRSDAQWIVAVYAGAAQTRAASLTVNRPGEPTSLRFEDVRFDGRSFQSPIYYGYRVSRVLSSRGGVIVGGEFIHAKIYADGSRSVGAGVRRGAPIEAVAFSSVIQRFALSHGMNFILVSAGIRRPLSRRVTVLAAGGAGPMLPHAELEIDNVSVDRYQLAGVGTQAAFGVETRLWRRIALLTEYKWTRARMSLELADGQIELRPSSHHVAIGLAAVFGRRDRGR